jgi:putative colanic acid biosynthesis UDP-glucose lipid carrier transferase
MSPRRISSLQFLLILMDVLVLNSIALAGAGYIQESSHLADSRIYLLFGPCSTVVWLSIAAFLEIYQGKYIFQFSQFMKRSVRGLFYLLPFLVTYMALLHFNFDNWKYAGLFVASIPATLIVARLIYLFIYYLFLKKNLYFDNVVVIGYNNLSRQFIQSLEEHASHKNIVGICEEREKVHEPYHYPILSNLSNAAEVCRQHHVTEIYSSIAPEENRSLYTLIEFAERHCIHFHIIADPAVFINRKCYLNYKNGIAVISLRQEPLEEPFNRMLKSVFDKVFSFFVVVTVLSWMVPVIGLLIKLDSRGPVFFKQVRTGRGNRKFNCLKFRSMRTNEQANELQATRNDLRLTRIGRFLRRTSLDEFPQFLNVLNGDMSIVGPRPHMLHHTLKYSEMMKHFMVRQFLEPGITGWAQVYGYRGEIDSLEKLQRRVEHDLWYMENWCFWLDIKIIFMTVFTTMKGDKNAY